MAAESIYIQFMNRSRVDVGERARDFFRSLGAPSSPPKRDQPETFAARLDIFFGTVRQKGGKYLHGVLSAWWMCWVAYARGVEHRLAPFDSHQILANKACQTTWPILVPTWQVKGSRLLSARVVEVHEKCRA